MNPRAQLIVEFVKAYSKKYGVSPSYEVIAKAVGLKAKSNVHRIIRQLETAGMVKTRPKKYYSIKIVDKTVDDVVKL
jgi:SOS-response transcriptional repressor LexA